MPVPEVKYTKLFINNEFVDSVSGATFETINPVTEQAICSVSEGGKADVDIAVAAARWEEESTEVGFHGAAGRRSSYSGCYRAADDGGCEDDGYSPTRNQSNRQGKRSSEYWDEDSDRYVKKIKDLEEQCEALQKEKQVLQKKLEVSENKVYLMAKEQLEGVLDSSSSNSIIPELKSKLKDKVFVDSEVWNKMVKAGNLLTSMLSDAEETRKVAGLDSILQ